MWTSKSPQVNIDLELFSSELGSDQFFIPHISQILIGTDFRRNVVKCIISIKILMMVFNEYCKVFNEHFLCSRVYFCRKYLERQIFESSMLYVSLLVWFYVWKVKFCRFTDFRGSKVTLRFSRIKFWSILYSEKFFT